MKPLMLTMGDAAGIGPEIILKAWGNAPGPACIVGSAHVMRRAASNLDLKRPIAVLDTPNEDVPPGAVAVWEPPGMPNLEATRFGTVQAVCGQAAALCIEHAVRAVQSGQSSGLVTAPIHKEAMHAAGSPYPGHTEMLQALAGQGPVRMMLANDELRVVLVTVHLALRKAVDLISAPLVLETLRITHDALQRMGIPRPRLAVAGLNPHAGEGGLFGREEIEHIAPAIAQAQALGIDAQGPFAPDTVFMRARAGAYDAVLAMTHDHGLIPVKYLGLDQGVNVTLGLPFVRTSPDHGTAFDIAGQGKADAASFLAAWRLAERLAQRLAGSKAASC
jgi:4-hydroxythreonine-4-phosphate dehydrogenase